MNHDNDAVTHAPFKVGGIFNQRRMDVFAFWVSYNDTWYIQKKKTEAA